jgi:hypothetical protein
MENASSPERKPYASKPASDVSKEGEKGLGPHLALTLLSTRGGSRIRSVDW